LELDLVEISPKASPPVCKILDYKKFLYEQKKREKALKSKATKVIIKEIRFGPQTDEHDYEFKKKHAEKFLNDGAKLKAFVFFKGRSIVFKDQGQILLLRLAQDLEEIGKVEPITFGVVIKEGQIQKIKVLEFREIRGWEVRYPAFTKQFEGASLKGAKLDRNVDGISGATLSVWAMTSIAELSLFLDDYVKNK